MLQRIQSAVLALLHSTKYPMTGLPPSLAGAVQARLIVLWVVSVTLGFTMGPGGAEHIDEILIRLLLD